MASVLEVALPPIEETTVNSEHSATTTSQEPSGLQSYIQGDPSV
jgi:hypothetical protein